MKPRGRLPIQDPGADGRLDHQGGGYHGGGGGGTSTMPSRETATATTGSLTPGQMGEVSISIPKSCDVQKIATDYPAWVVIYNTPAARTADAARLSAMDPTPGMGVMAEVITISTRLSIPMSPVPVFVNDDATPVDTAYLRIQNLDGTSRAITVTLTFDRREA